MFIVALFTIAKICKQAVSISRWMDEKAVVHLHTGMLLGHKKEGNFTPCNSMSGPGEHYAKWNKPGVRDKYHMISPLTGNNQQKKKANKI